MKKIAILEGQETANAAISICEKRKNGPFLCGVSSCVRHDQKKVDISVRENGPR